MKIVTGEELAGKKFEVLEDGSLRMIENGKYIPRNEEYYFFLNSFDDVEERVYKNYTGDKWLVKHNLVFRTRKECEEYKQFIKLLDEYTFEPDWKDLSKDKYYLIYKAEVDKVFANLTHKCKISPYYYESLDKLNKFIEKAGKQNIKRFMFDIWE